MKRARPLRVRRLFERAERGRSGIALVEVLCAATVLVVAVTGTMASITSAAILGESNRESALANRAVESTLEVLRGTDFGDLVVLYNADPADDPAGAETAPGTNFAVPGLDAQKYDQDGWVGRVVLPTIEGELREDLYMPDLGMPRDLNGDGKIDSEDHSDDYVVLPVLIEIAWAGNSGRERTIEVESLLSGR